MAFITSAKKINYPTFVDKPAPMYKRVYMLPLFFYFVVPGKSIAQLPDTLQQPKAGSSSIREMHEYISLKLSATDNMEGFVVRTKDVKYDLRPNDRIVARLALNYRFIAAAVSVVPGFVRGNDDNSLKGKSTFTSYSLGFNFHHWLQNFSYTKARGFYLHNTNDYRRGWTAGVDPYIQFPDLVYQSYQGQTAYKWNKNFSFASLQSQTERQLKSAGTFLPSLSYRYYIVDDKTRLTAQRQTQKSNNLEALLSAAYYYTQVVQKKIYISAGIAPGAGVIFTKLLTRSTDDRETTRLTNAIYRLEANTAIGYNGERFFAGAQLNGSLAFYSRKKVFNVIENEKVFYQVFAGYRLGAPRKIRQLFDRMEQKKEDLLQKELHRSTH